MKTIDKLDGREIPVEMRLDTILDKLNALKPGEGLELTAPHEPEKLLRKVIERYPLQFDFSPLQTGPAQWRVHFHKREQASPRSVFAYLAWDHDRLDEILNQARVHVEGEQWEEAHAQIEDFRVGLFRHIHIEEDVLFPVFEEASDISEGGPTTVMRHEHVDIKEAVNGMVSAITISSRDEFERCHANLLGVLIEHNMKEENILYPLTDRSVDDVARNRLVEELLLG